MQETLFHEKQRIIEGCLFGVDINPNSVKICRLRLWIELLKSAYYKQEGQGQAGQEQAGQDLTGFENLSGLHLSPSGGGAEERGGGGLNQPELETLPNIDINIKCGNSLISRFGIDADLGRALKKSKWTIDGYRVAVDTYRNAHSKEQKRKMEELIEDIKSDFKTEIGQNSKEQRQLDRLGAELYQKYTAPQLFGDELTPAQKKKRDKDRKKLEAKIDKLTAAIEEIKNNKIYQNAFEWRFEFPEVLDDNGDFTGFDVVIGNPPYIRQEALKEFKEYFKVSFSLYTGTSDIYVFFIEKGFDVLKPNGVFTYIMPNKFMQAGYGQPARRFLLQHNLLELIDFGDLQVFDEATTYPCILTAAKESPSKCFTSVAVETLDFKDDFEHYVKSIGGDFEQAKMTDDTWTVSSAADQILLEKIKTVSNKLEAYLIGEANYGVKPGLSEAFFIDDETKNAILEKDPKSEKLLRPLLRGRNVTPWFSKANGNWLIATFPSLRLDIDEYPGIKDHLLSFGKKRLEQTGEKGSRKKTSGKWFETQDSIGYWREFEKPKIMYQVFQVKPCFVYDDTAMYCNNSMWIIPTGDKVLLGILNSKLGWWLISKYCTAIQNGYQLIWKYFSQIPIAKGSAEQRTEITARVNEILAAKKEDTSADTRAMEAEIDELVYELYGLTEEERGIVEGR